MTERAPDYRLHIGELRLDGFEADPAAISAALRRELARVAADPHGPFAARAAESRALSIREVALHGAALAPDASPREIGRAAARAIVDRIGAAAVGPASVPDPGARGRR